MMDETTAPKSKEEQLAELLASKPSRQQLRRFFQDKALQFMAQVQIKDSRSRRREVAKQMAKQSVQKALKGVPI